MDQRDVKCLPAAQEIFACRVCLATSGKMFCLGTYELRQAFLDITGIQVTLELIEHIYSLHGNLLQKTNIVYVNLVDNTSGSNHTLDVDEDTENCFNDYKEIDDKLTAENDFNDFEQDSIHLTTVIDEQSSTSDITPNNKAEVMKNTKSCEEQKKFDRDTADREVIQFIINNPSAELYSKMLYKYIHNKYNNITLKDESGDLDEDKPLSKLTVTAKNNTLIISNDEQIPLNKFYNYLRDSHGYTDADRNATVKGVSKKRLKDHVGKKIEDVSEIKKVDFDHSRKIHVAKAAIDRAATVKGVSKKRSVCKMVKKVKDVAKVKNFNYDNGGRKAMEMRIAKAAMEFVKKYNFEVVRLSKEEQLKDMHARKETDRYKMRRYKCEDCYIGFQHESKYDKHRQQHDPILSGSYECELCKLRFHSKKRLHIHTHRTHKFKYTCKQCGKTFQSRSYSKEHYMEHMGNSKYECKYCPSVFKRLGSYMDHARRKHGTVFCDICHVVLTPRGVPNHMNRQHQETFPCPTCDKVFNDAAALGRHIKLSPDELCDRNKWPCTMCGEVCDTEAVLQKHIDAYHRTIQNQRRKSAVPKRLQRDKESVPKRDKGNVQQYEYSVMCESCGLICYSMAHLRQHTSVHTGERPLQCAECHKRFRTKGLLQSHMRTHTGEKPYQCPECSKAFSSPTNLQRHQLVHSKIRPYTCPICNNTYQQAEYVKVHIRTVHMKIPNPPRIRNRRKRVGKAEEEEEGTRVAESKKDRRVVQPDKKRRVAESEEDESRKQRVAIKAKRLVNIGAPQGSVLGPSQLLSKKEKRVVESEEQRIVKFEEDSSVVEFEEEEERGVESEEVERIDVFEENEERIEDCEEKERIEEEAMEVLEDWNEYGD